MSDPVRKGGSVRWVPPEEWKPAAIAADRERWEAEKAAWRQAHPWLTKWWKLRVIIRRLIGR